MYLIAVYDISTVEKAGQRRLNRIMKTFRRYLHHTQKSVFEGEITEAKCFALKKEVNKIISKDSDQAVFFQINNKKQLKKEILGMDFDATSAII